MHISEVIGGMMFVRSDLTRCQRAGHDVIVAALGMASMDSCCTDCCFRALVVAREGAIATLARLQGEGLTAPTYLKYPTTIRVVSSTNTFTIFSDNISAPFSTVLCATASIVLTHMNAASAGSILRMSLRWRSR